MTETKDADSKNENAVEMPKELVTKIQQASNYCYNCNRCVNVCPLSQLGIFSPRSLINDLTFLTLAEAIENNNIWQCLTCGVCMEYCPMTVDNKGVDVPTLILELRELAVKMGMTAEMEKIHQCETHDGIFPLISDIMAIDDIKPNKLSFLEGSGLETSESGEVAYFVGCLPLMEDVIYQHGISYVDSAKAIINLLNEVDIKPVVLNEKCCGHDILWGRGDTETFKKLAEYNVKLYKDAGVKTIITGCAEGYRTWKYDYPKVIDGFDFEVLHLSEFMLKQNVFEHLRFPMESPTLVTYHDACRIGRLGGKLYDAPREVIKQIPGVKLIEMENNRENATCCGVSAFSGCNQYTRLIRKMRIEEAEKTGAEYLIVPCPKCLTHFTCYLSEPRVEKENRIKVIDLATFIGHRLFTS